jgi:phage anti-repressor protein
MELFLRKFSTLPKQFIKDFFIIAKEEYSDNEIIIDFNIVCEWLDIRKDNLKIILINNFEKDYDYTIEKKHKAQIKGNGRITYYEIFITPNCMKELCMISQSKKAKEVRKYFIEMEKLIKRYFQDIKDAMYKKIGLLETNQKPKTKTKGGVVYILESQNTDDTLYKLGKSDDLKKRLKTYNTGNANDIEPLFVLKVKNIHTVEDCIKALCKQYQYRKYKEVYQIDLDLFKIVIEKCGEISDKLIENYYNTTKKEFKSKISRMNNRKNTDKQHFIYIDKK